MTSGLKRQMSGHFFGMNEMRNFFVGRMEIYNENP